MKSLIFFSFLAICNAGYNYNGPIANSVNTLNSGSGFSSGSGFGLLSQGLANGGSFHSSSSSHHASAPIVTKRFFFHSAPEEHEEGAHKQLSLGAPRKNYNIIFIKAPHTGSGVSRLSLAHAPSEDKTVIYVLSKKVEVSDIQTDIQEAPHHHSKPEVFFIKYKTPEEAIHAQKQIQAQYDALGGSNQISDEVIGSVSSAIGSGVNSGTFNGLDSLSLSHESRQPSGYLPPN